MLVQDNLIGISVANRPIDATNSKIHNIKPFISMIPYKSPIGFDLIKENYYIKGIFFMKIQRKECLQTK